MLNVFLQRLKIKGLIVLALLNVESKFFKRVKLKIVETVDDLCQPLRFTSTFPAKPGTYRKMLANRYIMKLGITLRAEYSYDISQVSWERGKIKILCFADRPTVWMSRTSFFNFIQGKTVLSVRARVFWSFAEFFCALGPYKTNGCRFKFQVVIL